MQVKRAPEPTTISGPLTHFIELRYTPGGHAIAVFDIDTPDTDQRCEAWRELAETMAADDRLRPDAVIKVTGTIKAREWETREGERRTVDIMTITRYEYEAPF